jgi:hypothetical protein
MGATVDWSESELLTSGSGVLESPENPPNVLVYIHEGQR